MSYRARLLSAAQTCPADCHSFVVFQHDGRRGHWLRLNSYFTVFQGYLARGVVRAALINDVSISEFSGNETREPAYARR